MMNLSGMNPNATSPLVLARKFASDQSYTEHQMDQLIQMWSGCEIWAGALYRGLRDQILELGYMVRQDDGTYRRLETLPVDPPVDSNHGLPKSDISLRRDDVDHRFDNPEYKPWRAATVKVIEEVLREHGLID